MFLQNITTRTLEAQKYLFSNKEMHLLSSPPPTVQKHAGEASWEIWIVQTMCVRVSVCLSIWPCDTPARSCVTQLRLMKGWRVGGWWMDGQMDR